MLDYLHIKNIVLIDEIKVDFARGLNVLSGETGAGKSIIMESIKFALGARASQGFVRQGEKEGFVEAVFSVENAEIANFLQELGIDISEDNLCIIYRSVTEEGKVSSRINGRVVTVSTLKAAGAYLLDVYGQHDSQLLVNSAKHIILLDRFCGDDFNKIKQELAGLHASFAAVKKTIEKLSLNDMERQQKIDLYAYQIAEIEEANLSDGEEDELDARKTVLSQANKLANLCGVTADKLLYGDLSADDALSGAVKALSDAARIDANLDKTLENLTTAHILMQEAARDIKDYSENLENNAGNLDEIEERLNVIYNLKRKYGRTVSDVLAYYEKISTELSNIENNEKHLEEVEAEKARLQTQIEKICLQITSIRTKNAEIIELEIEKILNDLAMKGVKFKIKFDVLAEFGPNGQDDVSFLISPNPGEPLKPLDKIASGGELSRVMLALKAVLSGADSIDTFIFDEIDAGISGQTAQKVAEKLAHISRANQILCITHLPQIAAMANANFIVEKKVSADKTISTLNRLNEDETVMELARLIGGAKITEATISAAREMHIMCENFK